MNTSFGKPEQDLQANRVKQEFNNASSGYTPPPASSEATKPPKTPEQVLKPDGVTEKQAQAAAGLSPQPPLEPSNSLENKSENALGLDQGQELGLGL